MIALTSAPDLSGDDYKRWKKDNDRAQEEARRSGQELLAQEPWAYELLALYADRKDWRRDGPEYSTAYVKDALRCIREGSHGLLFNPPLL